MHQAGHIWPFHTSPSLPLAERDSIVSQSGVGTGLTWNGKRP